MKMKRWVVATSDAMSQNHLLTSGYSALAASALCARGITNGTQAATFLSTSADELHNPYLFPDMEVAVQIIQHAIEKGTGIAIFGDYDVDGVTATCILTQYLRSQGASVQYFLPNRLKEGYGLTVSAIDTMLDAGCGLLITVDGGISAKQEIDYARACGMQIVLTDHHQCPTDIPLAHAILNPQWKDCPYPFRDLAGVGVVFKLICGLATPKDLPDLLEQYAALVALGTVADVMPLHGENRILVAHGLRHMRRESQVGLHALLLEAGQYDKPLTASTISFILAPRINAAGRMGQAEAAVELFLTQDAAYAKQLAMRLCAQNRARQNTETDILNQALARLRKEYNPMEDKAIVLAGEGWHHGVLGIVSSRLCDCYVCPVFLIALEGGVGKGSGRAPQGFNLYEALTDSAPLLEKYGGHALAAGLTIAQDNLPAFQQQFATYARTHHDPVAMMPLLKIDAAITPDMISVQAVEGLSVLEPFGMGNPQPVFSMHNLVVDEITPISSDKHVRLSLRSGNQVFTAMLFGTGAGGVDFAQGNTVDVAFYLEINRFRGRSTVQLVVRDVRLSVQETLADQQLLNLYNCFINDGQLSATDAQTLLPTRPDLVAVWRHIISRAEDSYLSTHSNALSRRIGWESRRNINIGRLFVCLDVFSESQLLSYHFHEGQVNICIKHIEGKADISQSVVLATLQNMSQQADRSDTL